MGIPKFFRWMSERYQGLLFQARENQIPEIDNFYLDMNGIIHNCTHPCDGDVHFRITEEQMFEDIFNYINTLFKIIKPKGYFFLAVDGVAPRAKMNQQRGRRFRSAKEASDRETAAIQKGAILPDEQRFDSNCITPGTEFMIKLDKAMNEFIAMKLSSDPDWQHVKVIVSGHKTPGEGEHKVMDFIRYQRSQPDHDPETRHCLYGLDTDLIMLGLSSHEPNFVLLREDIKFNTKRNEASKGKSQRIDPSKITFNILDLKRLREYIRKDYLPLKPKLKFNFDLESIIDDWILICFLVGNDFIPHIPHFHIHKNALPKIFEVYQYTLTKLDGYMNENGILNLKRFRVFAKALSVVDFENYRTLLKENGGECAKDDFSKLNMFVRQRMRVAGIHQSPHERYNNHQHHPNQRSYHCNQQRSDVWYTLKRRDRQYENRRQLHSSPGRLPSGKNLSSTPNGKPAAQANGRGVHNFTEEQINNSITVCADGDFIDISDDESHGNRKIPNDRRNKGPRFNNALRGPPTGNVKNGKEPVRSRAHDLEDFKAYKNTYYREKLKLDPDPGSVLEVVHEYIRALQWNLHYYYHGCVSWGWFYPYHYAPFISDVANFTKVDTDFEMGEPFRPFDQLLSVLPAASSSLLPNIYRSLVTSSSSPLAQYFPTEVEYDLNGKQNDWEAVILAPFIDEEALLRASVLCNLFLTPEQRSHNVHGPHVLYYNERTKAPSQPSRGRRRQQQQQQHGSETSSVKKILIDRMSFCIPKEKIRYGLIKNAEIVRH